MRTLLILVFVFAISMSAATTLYVNLLQTSNPAANMYNTINEAYTMSNPGDIIMVYPGDYIEPITVAHNLTIMGTTQSSTRIITSNSTGINITGGTVTISNIHFKCPGGSGIKLSSGCVLANIRNCIFETCTYGVNVTVRTSIQIRNCIFRSCNKGYNQNTTNGILVSGLIANCIFHNSTTAGIYLNVSGISNYYSTFDVMNSIFVSQPSSISKDSSFDYSGTIDFNVFYSSPTSGVNLGTEYHTVDPSLTNIASSPYFNYFPMPGSPCINAGNPNVSYNDLDNSRNDIGIYGGPYQWGEGKPVVLDMQITPNPVQQGGTINIQATGQAK